MVIKEYYFKKWGLQIGRLSITWYDLWAKKICLEISWHKIFGDTEKSCNLPINKLWSMKSFIRNFRQDIVNKRLSEISYHPENARTDSFRNFYKTILCYLAIGLWNRFCKFFKDKNASDGRSGNGFNSKNKRVYLPLKKSLYVVSYITH